MFERFTDDARQVLVRAQEEARALEHDFIGTEHLLLALITPPATAATFALAEAGVGAERVRAAIVSLLQTGHGGPAPLDPDDAAALSVLGIDAVAVRAKVEQLFGPGALDRSPGARRRRRSWRPSSHRRAECRRERRAGDLTWRTKKVLELSLREALRLGHSSIGPEHILLGLLREGDGLAALVLVELGVSMDRLRTLVLARIGRVA